MFKNNKKAVYVVSRGLVCRGAAQLEAKTSVQSKRHVQCTKGKKRAAEADEAHEANLEVETRLDSTSATWP